MTVILFDNPVSGNCYKVRALLGLLGIPFERRELSVVDRSDRAEVLGGLNPSLRVPTVVLEDGRPLGESNAILWHFAEGTALLPEDRYERSQVLQWLFFEQYSHEPAIAVVRFWVAFAPDPPPAAEIEARRETGRAALSSMDRHLQDHDYLVGTRFTIADLALFAYTHIAPEGGFDLEPYPSLRRWLTRVAAQPGLVPMAA